MISKIDTLVGEFLDQKKIAVVGVSDRRETGCNSNFRNFKAAGYTVYPVNPRIQEFEGDRSYPDLASLPEKPDGVFILASPRVTEDVVRQCIELDIQHVWMHCILGTKPGIGASMTSVSPAAVEMCAKNGIRLIPGSCPNQFLNPDLGHAVMRRLWRAFGFLKVA
ncbi:MAG: CoA-binding protein [Chloroflexota bacterium]